MTNKPYSLPRGYQIVQVTPKSEFLILLDGRIVDRVPNVLGEKHAVNRVWELHERAQEQ